MIGVFEIAMAIVAAQVSGDELVLVVETEPVGIGFEGEGLSGQVGRDGIAVGVEGDAKLPGGAYLRDRGDIKGCSGQRAEMGLFALPKLDGGLRVSPCTLTLATVSSQCLTAGASMLKSAMSSPARKFFLT